MVLDYTAIAVELLYKGTDYQKKCITWYMHNLSGKKRTYEIRRFIDVQRDLGRLEV